MRTLIAVILVGCALSSNAQAPAPGEPAAQVDAIIAQLRAGKTSGVLERAFAGSLVLAQKAEQIRAMDGQAKAALDFVGPLTSSEVLEFKRFGGSLVRIKWITKHRDDIPFFWTSLFHRRNGQWEPLVIVFTDEPAKAGLLQ